MPELPEVERYREAAEWALHREVKSVYADDAWYLKHGLTAKAMRTALEGASFIAARRIGKLLLLDMDEGPVVGLRFGMSGRLVIDGNESIDDWAYSSKVYRPEWDRFAVDFVDGGRMSVQDPRRLGGVELHPDEDVLGPDARAVTLRQLRIILGASTAPVKARVMDQSHLAGVGNLIADEAFWRAGIDPARLARSLGDDEVRRLHKAIRSTIELVIRRGGSHTGDLQPERVRGGICPRDRAPLVRRTVGGRTTYSCSVHQN